MSLRLDIQGQGPSALALQRMLKRMGWQGPISSSDSLPPASSDAGKRPQRSLALSAGSLQLIRACTGAIPPGADIRIVEVQTAASGAGKRGIFAGCQHTASLVLHHDDLGLERLGRVVTWDDLVAHLQPKPAQQDCLLPAEAAADSSKTCWSIKIWADGDPGDEAIEVDEQQSAIVGRVSVQGAPSGWALERLTPEGALALLPDTQAQAMQLVWCSPQSIAEQRLRSLYKPELDSAVQVLRALNMALPSGIRVLGFEAPMQCIRLKRRARAHMVKVDAEGRSAEIWIGNAAQILHPIAGQGFNLAMRDAAELARCLVNLQGGGISAQTFSAASILGALRGFEAQRQRDRRLMMQMTDQLARQSTRPWFQLLAPQAFALARFTGIRRLIAEVFAFGLRDPWPLLG